MFARRTHTRLPGLRLAALAPTRLALTRLAFASLAMTGSLLVSACQPTDTATVAAKLEPFVHRVRAEGNLTAVSSTPISVPNQVRRRARVAWMAEDGSRVETGDVVLRFDARDMQRKLEGAMGDLEKAGHEGTKTVAESDNKLTSVEKSRELADLELAVATKFRFEDTEVYSRNAIIESDIDGELAQTKKDHATSVGAIRQDLRTTDTALTAISKKLARQRITEAENGLAALEIKAPHPGLLTWSRGWSGEPIKVGEEVWRGRELGELPNLSELDAEVYVLEADAGGIEAGQGAVLSIDSRPGTAIKATVVSIDAVSEPRFRGSPVRFFGVTLRPDTTDPSFMKPGQRVSALIYVQDLAEALVVPKQAIHRTAGKTYVFKRSGAGFQPTAVTLGPQSIALAVIASGIEIGDEVALEEPAGLEDDLEGFIAEVLSDSSSADDDSEDKASSNIPSTSAASGSAPSGAVAVSPTAPSISSSSSTP